MWDAARVLCSVTETKDSADGDAKDREREKEREKDKDKDKELRKKKKERKERKLKEEAAAQALAGGSNAIVDSSYSLAGAAKKSAEVRVVLDRPCCVAVGTRAWYGGGVISS